MSLSTTDAMLVAPGHIIRSNDRILALFPFLETISAMTPAGGPALAPRALLRSRDLGSIAEIGNVPPSVWGEAPSIGIDVSCRPKICQALFGPASFCLQGTCQPTVTLNVSVDNRRWFNATLQNRANFPIIVSAFVPGNLWVASLRDKNGQEVSPEHTQMHFAIPPEELAVRALSTLAASGGKTSLKFKNLSTVVFPDPAQPQDLEYWSYEYEPLPPGAYTVVFGYQYRGSDAGKLNVHHGTVFSNEVNFNVQ